MWWIGILWLNAGDVPSAIVVFRMRFQQKAIKSHSIIIAWAEILRDKHRYGINPIEPLKLTNEMNIIYRGDKIVNPGC